VDNGSNKIGSFTYRVVNKCSFLIILFIPAPVKGGRIILTTMFLSTKKEYQDIRDCVIKIAKGIHDRKDDYLGNIINNMNLIVYVIGLNGQPNHMNHEIVYMSERAKEVFGDGEGKMCYEFFNNFTYPCDVCFNKEMVDHPGDVFKWIRFNNVLNTLVEIQGFVVIKEGIKFKVSVMRELSFIMDYLRNNPHYLNDGETG
jgi:hypothetical protein